MTQRTDSHSSQSPVDPSARAPAGDGLPPFDLAVAAANDGLWDWDLRTGHLRVSARWKAILGYADGDLPSAGDGGRLWLERAHADDRDRLAADLRAFAGEPCHGPGVGAVLLVAEYRMRHRDGTYRPVLVRAAVLRDAAGQAVRAGGSVTDLTDRKLAERLCRDAFHDSLTGLANRGLLLDRLRQCLRRSQRQPGYFFAVLALDVDRLRVINDTLGQAAGDELLAAVAARLSACVRGLDTVARGGSGGVAEWSSGGVNDKGVPEDPGASTRPLDHSATPPLLAPAVARIDGDQFVLVLDGIADPTGAVRVAERVRAALGRPFTAGGQEVFCSAGIGIALGHERYQSPEDVLRDAETALYQAKAAASQAGGGTAGGQYQVFDPARHAAVMARWRTENDLRHAVGRGDLRLVYQPVVDLAGGDLIELEALVRWPHPDRGMISPAEFIPLAEETGLIVPLGYWVLREACRQLRRWDGQLPSPGGAGSVAVAVNVSPRQFAQADLVEQFVRIVNEEGIDPGRVRLEITESAVFQDAPPSAGDKAGNANGGGDALDRLRDAGFGLHLDDFGTGYSSLATLHRLPIDALKIDRSFIDALGTDATAGPFVQTIIALANRLELGVIAEGIENPAQLAWLRRAGVGCGQGYYFARPMDPANVVEWAAKRTAGMAGVALAAVA